MMTAMPEMPELSQMSELSEMSEPWEQSLENELANVAALEGVIGAWVCRADPAALTAAVARVSANDGTPPTTGEPASVPGGAVSAPGGLLAGWTVGVKDVIDTADFPTERGSPIHAGRCPTSDAACVALVRAAGAVVAGKTVTTEFALFSPAGTANPYDSSRTPGGSSSGSAAAVAAGMCRMAFGTQTVGSVLRPAAYCGVVGFKPTYDLVPPTGVATLAHSLDTVGWFTSTVDDAAQVLSALTGAERPALAEQTAPPTIGICRTPQWRSAEPETVTLVAEVAEQLAAAGARVVDVDADHLSSVFDAADVTLHYESLRALSPELNQRPEAVDTSIRKMMARAEGITFADYAASRRTIEAARAAHEDGLDGGATGFRLDAVLCPAAPGEAPPLATTGDSVFNRVWSALGVPAIALPAGQGPSGLPLAVQLTGRRWQDPELLGVARWVTGVLPPQVPLPPHPPSSAGPGTDDAANDQ